MNLRENDLRLRPIVLPDDVSIAVRWYQDPEVLYFSEGGANAVPPYNAERVEKMYNYLLKEGEVFIIEILNSDRWMAIGDVAVCSDCMPIVIGDGNYRSKGIGKRVLSLMIQHARSQGRKKLRVNGIYTFNERSLKLFRGLGFTELEKYVDEDGNEAIPFELILTEK